MHMDLEIRIVVDKSGSMETSKKKVVEGLNAYLGQVRRDPAGKKAFARIVNFDSMGTDILRQGVAAEIKDISLSEYVPRALTPLHDNVAAALTDAVETNKKYVVVIFTDGLENASKGEYREANTLRALVKRKQGEGFVILYLGANIDAWKQAEEIGIPPERAMNVRVNDQGEPVKKGLFSWGSTGSTVAKAFIAAAAVGLAYNYLTSGSAQAAGKTGFSDEDRNAAMGVDGVSKTWQDAVQEDIAGFNEPMNSMFDLPPDLQQAVAELPSDFDPLKGSMNEDGSQNGGFDYDGEVANADDRDALTEASGDDEIVDSSDTSDSYTPDPDPAPSTGGGFLESIFGGGSSSSGDSSWGDSGGDSGGGDGGGD